MRFGIEAEASSVIMGDREVGASEASSDRWNEFEVSACRVDDVVGEPRVLPLREEHAETLTSAGGGLLMESSPRGRDAREDGESGVARVAIVTGDNGTGGKTPPPTPGVVGGVLQVVLLGGTATRKLRRGVRLPLLPVFVRTRDPDTAVHDTPMLRNKGADPVRTGGLHERFVEETGGDGASSERWGCVETDGTPVLIGGGGVGELARTGVVAVADRRSLMLLAEEMKSGRATASSRCPWCRCTSSCSCWA